MVGRCGIVGRDLAPAVCGFLRGVEGAAPYSHVPRSDRIRRDGHCPSAGEHSSPLPTPIGTVGASLRALPLGMVQLLRGVVDSASFAATPQNLDGLRRRRMSTLQSRTKVG